MRVINLSLEKRRNPNMGKLRQLPNSFQVNPWYNRVHKKEKKAYKLEPTNVNPKA
jgi:hypothetical protein